MASVSYFLGDFLVAHPLWKHGTAIIYFGPTKTIKERIHVETTRNNEYLFSNGEIMKKTIFSKIYTAIRVILAILAIYYSFMCMYYFVFYICSVDLVKLIYTGEWQRGEKMTSSAEYE